MYTAQRTKYSYSSHFISLRHIFQTASYLHNIHSLCCFLTLFGFIKSAYKEILAYIYIHIHTHTHTHTQIQHRMCFCWLQLKSQPNSHNTSASLAQVYKTTVTSDLKPCTASCQADYNSIQGLWLSGMLVRCKINWIICKY
jgi:hypothetical protein